MSFVAAVDVGAGVVPGAEHGLDGAHQLLLGVGGEVLADLGLVLGLELAGQLLQVLGGQLHVLGDAACSSFISSMSCSKYFLPTSMTTSEYIWIKRR